ncbi:MAG TPA: hypothetical protein PL009_13700 [Flavipsychrobacter sp.]|nr:hypothetical protein [Flavipsychrobacter sp.]
MLRLRLFLFINCFFSFSFLSAQDYSNRGLMEIKDHSEGLRMAWIKSFDEAVQTKNFSALQPLRKENENYLDKHMLMIRRLYADGDGRALLSAVNNYMRIERQFVKDVMVPAEAFTANSQEGIDRTYQKIDDFGQKEKVFLIEINNAMRTESMDAGGAAGNNADAQMQEQEEESFDEPQGSVIEGRPKRKKGRLPHEQENNDEENSGKRSKKKKNVADEEE